MGDDKVRRENRRALHTRSAVGLFWICKDSIKPSSQYHIYMKHKAAKIFDNS
jgi:hypothetical protein